MTGAGDYGDSERAHVIVGREWEHLCPVNKYSAMILDDVPEDELSSG